MLFQKRRRFWSLLQPFFLNYFLPVFSATNPHRFLFSFFYSLSLSLPSEMEYDQNPIDLITDYHKTQRIVFLIDLNPLLHLQNPAPFINCLLSSTKTFLSFKPISSSLFAFKLFFSSLSPLLSSSKLHPFLSHSSRSLSFDRPIPTFNSLSQTLNSLPSFHANPLPDSSPRASCLAASMRQLLHDYAWDSVIDDDRIAGTVLVRSNLVVLFSQCCRSLKCLSEFLNVGMNDECLENASVFNESFCALFSNVNDAFLSRDIQFSWVDVRYGIECGEDEIGIHESESSFGFLKGGISSLGWGFCSTSSIVLGSSLVPFGLIYPKILISSNIFCFGGNFSEKLQVQLSLEILDVTQKPLECKCGDLEFIDLNLPRNNRSEDDYIMVIPEMKSSGKVGNELKKTLWSTFGDGVKKLQIKALRLCVEFEKFKGQLSDPILVRECLGKTGKDQKGSSSEHLADKVLEMLAIELGEFVPRKSTPIWQILLSFLYREGYWALVSLSNHCGDSRLGILKPFTVSSALLFILDDGFDSQMMLHELDGAKDSQFCRKMNLEISEPNTDLKPSYGPSPSAKCSEDRDGKKKGKRQQKLLQDITWTAFCKAAFKHSELKLEEVYFAGGCTSSKKLKFLKCWMRQTKKSSCSNPILEENSKPHPDLPEEVDDRLPELHQENEQPISSSASAGENFMTENSRIQDEAAAEFRAENPEAFLSNLSSKIIQGLESEGVDLRAFAQRLVSSSIYWLSRKLEIETNSESQTSGKTKDNGGFFTAELFKLLLRDPKDLIAKNKSNDPSFQAPDPGSASEKIVREYELQILFRMEILQSEVAEYIGESMKQKFVKQICSLLETIQCHLEGGFFGDWSLDNYVGKIIKARYCDTLGDVVNKIYKRMDLLLFADEDELPNRLLNSEDSNQSWKQNPARDELGENHRITEPVSADGESHKPLEDDNASVKMITKDDHARKLIKARERRERARRFSSFTSWVPDLQRVWAPKQPKVMKPNWNPLRKHSKRKKDRGVASYDTVCETPMTGKENSSRRRSCIDDEEDYQGYNNNNHQPCSSVSKALFQDPC
ncbi:uncharacterized protein LOC107414533 [Ziziphus jujuba]|uniref:Uncharacterized protein LOC107414533 n=1 Tax=Ziziphus jujuba TaxID=326968 RepID=A0A6P3ZFQ6_ZIZJJ|nr:uncharacterized protein LOC107414533 [Ziziphus jujuba]